MSSIGPFRCPCPLAPPYGGAASQGKVVGHLLRLKSVHEADGLDDLGSQQGCHAGIKRLAQVRRPSSFRRNGVQHLAGLLQ